MQTSAVITSAIDVELPEWLLVPPTADDAWRTAAASVFDSITRVERELPEEDRLLEDGTVVDADAAVEHLLRMAADLDGDDRLVTYLGVPNRWPLPVIVSVGFADPDTALLELAGATGGTPVERPSVEELPDDVAGDGPVVTRYDLDDSGALVATICCVRRLNGIDTRVMWRTSDLQVVPLFAPALVALVAAVQNSVQNGVRKVSE